MISMTLSAAAAALDAQFCADDRTFNGASTDTRSLGPGQLFFALRGPNFDAHEKLDEAQAAGAVAAVVERAMPSRLPQLLVADTRAALGQLARAWRQRFDIPVLAVTGSAGKTTVKEMLAAIMRTQGPVLATRGNFNNDIGLPLTLFQLDASHRAAVLEMGANHVGDITLLVAIARPHIGVITLCAPGHLEGFGSIEGVARTKGEMFAGLPDDGIAILNADDAQAPLWRELAGKRRVSSFGLSADFRAENIQATADGSVFTLRSPAGAIEITLKHRGLHNVRNALAAAAAASAAGVSLADIQRGLAEAGIVKGRLQYRAGSVGCRIIDDSYNANPASVAAAIAVLGSEPAPRWLVFGDMRELGPDAVDYHREVGAQAAAAGVTQLFTYGALARHAAERFAGFAQHADSHGNLLAALRAALSEAANAPPTLLIKGSRAMALDEVANALAEGSDVAC
ncbi:MAG: UDP-N-acetylmuramoyl-tripeptide--D-alanyl-D-alanine ligase [Gammaproteobacteria bacterium]|nr:UDP-N-acetylmuramoyl-tripeptide--D-alanyl-D-alanine ligase [Gammaproteobacteria bacterium]